MHQSPPGVKIMAKKHWQKSIPNNTPDTGFKERDMPPEHHQKRWYDHIANVTHAVYLSKQLPVGIQNVIAKNLNEYIDTYRQLAKKDKNAISLGSNRILGLYKAKYGHRWYDPNAKLGRAFNMMATIPERFVEEYAGRIILVANYVLQKQQQQLHVNTPEMAGAVTTILAESYVSLREGDSGIKLVSQSGHHLDSHIVAMGEPMPDSRHVLRHKKHR